MNKNLKKVIIALCFGLLIFPAMSVMATTDMEIQTGFFTDSSGLDTSIDTNTLVGTIIALALSLLGIIFVVLIIVSGYQWMTAGGNEEAVKTARTRMVNAIIGLVIVLSAYIITAFVFKTFAFNDGGALTGGTSGR